MSKPEVQFLKTTRGKSFSYKPDTKISRKEIEERRRVLERPEPPDWLEVHDGRAGRLSWLERQEIRASLQSVQVTASGASEQRARRLLEVLDAYEAQAERQITIEKCGDQAADLVERAVPALAESIKDALTIDLTERLADVLQDNPQATAAEAVALAGDLFAAALAEAQKEARAAVELVEKAAKDHAALLETLTDYAP